MGIKDLFRNMKEKIKRHALHAEGIGFVNPRNNKPVDFSAQMPEDFLNTLNFLGQIS